MDFQPHIEGKQALSWDKNCFLRYEFTFSHSPISLLGNHKVFFRFLIIPSQALENDETKDDPSSYHIPIQVWIEKSCGYMYWHGFVYLSYPNELDFIFFYGVVFIPTHDHFMLDISLIWFITERKVRIFYLDEMLGWFYWLYDYN
jgi:hypothetical protein